MDQDNAKLQQSIVSIASELFRFQRVFEKAISKIDIDERGKYMSQFSWFSKKVLKAVEEANLKVLNPEGQLYDPGMAVTPLNIDDFETDDRLYVLQTIEPIIMQDDKVFKTGTVILGRVKK
jgi:molecular chaperone GrpE (heat shock protein)